MLIDAAVLAGYMKRIGMHGLHVQRAVLAAGETAQRGQDCERTLMVERLGAIGRDSLCLPVFEE